MVFMIVMTIVLLIFGIFLFVLVVRDLVKEKGALKEKVGGTIIGAICLIVCLILSTMAFYKLGAEAGELKTMRQRLHEPVSSEVQLYGCEIIGKHSEKGAFGRKLCFIDIKDWWVAKKILKNVETTEKFFNENELGAFFNETGKAIPPEEETNEPNAL